MQYIENINTTNKKYNKNQKFKADTQQNWLKNKHKSITKNESQ